MTVFLRFALLSVFLFFNFFPLAAQELDQAVIRGRVVDASTGQPLEFASVSVLDAETGSLKSGGVTDLDGAFEVPVPIGEYQVKVEFLSYQSQIVEDVRLSATQATLALGTISLSTDATVIEEIEVIGEKSQLQMGLDKRVFNVGQDLARTGGSAADLLDNIPSVAVDAEGGVSLRGSGNVRILIDGKPSGLVGIGDANGLQLLQGNLIESVEIITNPSAKYEAEGSAGIINIILKKERKDGVNGSVDLNAGFPHNYGAAANINLRRKFLNLFGNFGFNYRERPGMGNALQTFSREDTTYYIDRSNDFERTGVGGNGQIGAEFFINSTNTLSTAFLFRRGKDDNFNETVYREFGEGFIPSDITSRLDEEAENESTVEYNINYRKTFQRKGQEFTAVAQYQDNWEEEQSAITERLFSAAFQPIGGDPLLQRSLNDERERQLLLRADYVQPFGKEGKFETGYRSDIRQIDNTYLVEELRPGEDWVVLDNFSNVFDYSEKIHALYATLGNKLGRISLQGGLRAEYSDISTRLIETNEINDRTYFNLFPSIFLGYELSGNQTVQVSYSRRIQRPRFWDLNPFFSFSDNRNIRSGNPNLDPMLTDSYEMTYLKYWDQASLSGSVYYRQTDNVIQRITSLLNDTVTLVRPENLSLRDEYGVELVMSGDIGKVWRVNGALNFFRAITDGGERGEIYAADTYSWTGRINSRLRMWKMLDLQLMFNYRAPEREPQGRQLSTAFLDAGLSMDVFQGNGTLNLNIRDVFNSRIRRFETDFPGYFAEGKFRWGVTSVILGFTYRLNQQKKQGRGDRGGDGGGDFGGEF